MHASHQINCPPEIERRLVDLAKRSAPRESCGVLVGRHLAGVAQIQSVVEIPNLSADPDSFSLDPHQYRQIERLCDLEGRLILGIFHSHPRGYAGLSARDESSIRRLWGSESDWIYLICGLKEHSGSEIRAWALQQNSFSELQKVV